MLIQQRRPAVAAAALFASAEGYGDGVRVGRQLATRLLEYRGGHALLLALSQSSVVAAAEVARALRLQWDVLIARELFVPPYPTIPIGALCEGGGLCLNRAGLRLPSVTLDAIWRAAHTTLHDIAGQIEIYRGGRCLPALNRRPVILVDNGLGSGLMQLAALQALRRAHAQRCIVATPGGASGVADRVMRRADELVTLATAAGEIHEAVLAPQRAAV
jgi:predicted phosphoribosyltransferase